MTKVMINTKEQLREYVHSIHDYIRNSGAGYNMTALKIFNVFYSLKILEGQLEQYGLSKNCDWKYLRDKLEENSFDTYIYSAVNELRNICLNDNKGKHPLMDFIKEIYDDVDTILETIENKKLKKIMKKLGKKIDESGNTKPTELKNISYFIYHQIPNGLPHDFCKELFNKVDDLPFNQKDKNFDIKGKIYEYFIGRDKSAISDMGAYFTDRYLTNFIMDELSPECIDGKVQTMIDMFGGSGGMTLSYVDYIKQKYNPNWEEFDNYKNISHCDMSEDVVKIAAVEFYSLTGYFPDKSTQFIRTNSFKQEFSKKYKYIVSNPPYGGDKNDKTPEIQKKETIINYNKEELEKIRIKLDIKTKEFEKIIRKINIDYKKNINEDNEIIDIENNNILDINLFKSKVEELTDSTELEFIMMVRLVWQNIIFKQQNDEEIENGSKLKVNFESCSDFIKEYSKKIMFEYNVYSRQQFIQKIDEELVSETDKVKISNLNKCKNQLQNELDKIINKSMNIDVNFNDKESCSLVLLMNLLDDDGECFGVLKEGVFFDGKYSTLRCFLINNFNVTDVYSVGSKAFENTTTKTSIIRFKKNGKTKKINFWDIDVIKHKANKIEYDINYGNDILEPINQIVKVNKVKLCSATFEQLSKVNIKYNDKNIPNFDMNYSLNAKDYKKHVIDCPDGFELVKLGDIVEYYKTEISSEFLGGDYNYYTCSEKISKCNEPKNKGEYIILGTRGTIEKALHFIDGIFGCGNNMMLIKSNNTYFNKYIYFLFKKFINYIKNKTTGSVVQMISQSQLLSIIIPFPKDINKLKPQ